MDGWRQVRPARAHELVIGQVEEQIRRGALQRGDRLPGERQLSEMLGVSRTSVREALRSLEALGVITARTTAGPDSGPTLAEEPSSALTSMLRLHLALSNFTEAEVIQTRLMVEEWAVREASRNASAEQLERLTATLDAMDKRGLDILKFNSLDSEFHIGIANASGNRLVGYLTGALRDAVERLRLTAMRSLGPWSEVSLELQAQHRRILDCLRAGDESAAAEAIRAHLTATFPNATGDD